MNRNKQMVWLLGLTALSLVPVYVLLGWQSGGHSPAEITEWLKWFWRIEAGAWGLRALVESAALVYLFQTATEDGLSNKIIVCFEIALISLVALTVGLVIVSNGSGLSIANGLPKWLYWIWSFGVAAFAPLMMGSVGFAYKTHKPVSVTVNEIATIYNRIDTQGMALDALRLSIDNLSTMLNDTTTNEIVARRERVLILKQEGLTQGKIAEQLGVSVGTIRNDVKMLNGRAK